MPVTITDAESGKKIRALPDRKLCRVRAADDDITECLTEYPGMCRYALSFGYGHFCRHPERKEFTAVSGLRDGRKLKDAAPREKWNSGFRKMSEYAAFGKAESGSVFGVSEITVSGNAETAISGESPVLRSSGKA